MAEWWEGLNTFQQVMFAIAVPSTIIMIVLLILMLIGLDNDAADGFDINVDSINDEPLASFGGLKIFTLRGVLAFFSVGGWVSFLISPSLNNWIAGLIGFVSGLIAAFILAISLRAALKLEAEGNLNYINTIGKIGTVYIRIPKNKTGKGKITVTAQERFLEVDAVTEDDEDIKTGMAVEIVSLNDESTVVVTRK